MCRNTHRFSIFALAVVGLLALSTQAFANGQPQWPQVGRSLHCTAVFKDGSPNFVFNTIFHRLVPRGVPGPNLLSTAYVDNYSDPQLPEPVRDANNQCPDDRVFACEFPIDLAYKPGEIDQSGPGSVFEATVPGGQCKAYRVFTQQAFHGCWETHIAEKCVGGLANLKVQICRSRPVPCR